MMKSKSIKSKLVSIITTPIILSSLFIGIGSSARKLIAETTISPATYEDLARYEWMGINYVCIAR